MNNRLSLVLGGVRSGKSEFAENLAKQEDKPVVYLATGLASDPEMERRIQRHRESRPDSWETLEAPTDLAGCLQNALEGKTPPAVMLIDSLDSWVGNLLQQHEDEPGDVLDSLVEESLGKILNACDRSRASVILVSSEVGLTLVPPFPLGRRFQDLLGLVNQKVATAAGTVYLVVAGVPMAIKSPDKG
jgi:adenosylcobinamide kinase/adenosylcobinamide-phosphate guanylyltransferase